MPYEVTRDFGKVIKGTYSSTFTTSVTHVWGLVGR